ncbi:hypothetical protein EJ04DRAFT_306755 [Polyplosphaeria fusca]|uniref:Uncharacterized protein n=1 Tax=Polyplosphaeria fusca TaxID=682080 RepID=A0A9P4QX49_9PLEO|nr:hypothetical protein EJ04DRAFT_306755 [Polyplosphaeria fusca]
MIVPGARARVISTADAHRITFNIALGLQPCTRRQGPIRRRTLAVRLMEASLCPSSVGVPFHVGLVFIPRYDGYAAKRPLTRPASSRYTILASILSCEHRIRKGLWPRPRVDEGASQVSYYCHILKPSSRPLERNNPELLDESRVFRHWASVASAVGSHLLPADLVGKRIPVNRTDVE